MTNLNDHITALHEHIKKISAPNAVGFKLFINSEGVEYTFEERTPESLISISSSMRNICGEYVK